jgi:hypothetical protein
VIVDPFGDQKWSVSGSFARYVDAIATTIADASSAAGNYQTYVFQYGGASINPDINAPSLVETPAAIAQVFDWYKANGGPTLPTVGAPTIPGVSPRIGADLKSPSVLEYAAGINRQFGARGALRIDYVYRDWRDFYVQRTDLTTGRVTNALGQSFDLSLIENTNDLTRRYSGATFQGTYRLRDRADVGATYTLSRLWGNVDGESVTNGPIPSTVLHYPEYKQAAWNNPDGDLSADQRHRARLWINYAVPRATGLTLSAMQTLESGVPYGAASTNGVDPFPHVVVAGGSYLTPPRANTTTYYFSARDAYRTEGQKRTDFSVNYDYRVKTGSQLINFFVQAQVINLFNNYQLCGCGGTVFQNGGAVTQTRIDQTVRTAATNAGAYATFNPFTTTPVEGVNWARGPIFGSALNRLAWTSPRQFRLSFGVRF